MSKLIQVIVYSETRPIGSFLELKGLLSNTGLRKVLTKDFPTWQSARYSYIIGTGKPLVGVIRRIV